jgi:hypothetical protein
VGGEPAKPTASSSTSRDISKRDQKTRSDLNIVIIIDSSEDLSDSIRESFQSNSTVLDKIPIDRDDDAL